MRMIHGDYKIGEICRRTGTYACVACRQAGMRSAVLVKESDPFPICQACAQRGRPEVDTLWKLEG